MLCFDWTNSNMPHKHHELNGDFECMFVTWSSSNETEFTCSLSTFLCQHKWMCYKVTRCASIHILLPPPPLHIHIYVQVHKRFTRSHKHKHTYNMITLWICVWIWLRDMCQFCLQCGCKYSSQSASFSLFSSTQSRTYEFTQKEKKA